MRQVPHYLFIGNGRVSRHFQFYFSTLDISYSVWHRAETVSKLQLEIQKSSHILILINDDFIEDFIHKNLLTCSQILIHFSGSLVSELAYGTHPLMTFDQTIYSKDHYTTIPFIIDHDSPPFQLIFPSLPNPHVRLAKEKKAKYHALCVLSGNFSCMLWQKLISTFENEFKLNPAIIEPFLLKQTENILKNAKNALTGPLVRKDVKTITKNIEALELDPFQEVYKSFVECYKKICEGIENEYIRVL